MCPDGGPHHEGYDLGGIVSKDNVLGSSSQRHSSTESIHERHGICRIGHGTVASWLKASPTSLLRAHHVLLQNCVVPKIHPAVSIQITDRTTFGINAITAWRIWAYVEDVEKSVIILVNNQYSDDVLLAQNQKVGSVGAGTKPNFDFFAKVKGKGESN